MPSTVAFPNAETLMTEVQAATGLDDFGADNLAPNLARFLQSVEREARLNAPSAATLLDQVRRRLTNRLEVEQWYRTHPAPERAEPAQIISISGLPRTGTTALVNLMSLDDRFRPLRSWEQAKSCPPPVIGMEENDPRRLRALAMQQQIARERPDLVAMHLFDVDATEEDFEVLGASFQAQQYALPIFGYHEWWRTADLSSAFAYHRRILQLLQSRRPPHLWLLKAPAHCFHLDALFGAYPNARVIVTHRDPAKAVPSAVSLLSAYYPPEAGIDPIVAGQNITEHFRVGMERAMAARQKIGEDNFFDVHHTDFVAAPLETLERIYNFLGIELGAEMRVKMQLWLTKNRSGAHGVHRYTPEQFGLSASQLRSDFAPYIRRFNVAGEG